MSIEGIKFEFGVGGNDKANLVVGFKRMAILFRRKDFGKFFNLFQDGKNIKVKELIVDSKKV